ncbi:MAG TPA: MarC family protein [Chitinophagales bacterium]|nr:MarC family protein [Chitinophagales bacterium]HRG27489.1 MarC family protein [Chitinophagales bacterium]HRG84629.1 MarC family protein [Chitinophagales bacterium]HRH53829.1 MarC family protein [Chitinophagales bacterium]
MIAISITDIITISLTLFAIIDVLGNVPVIISMKNKGIVLQPIKTTIFAGVLMVTFLFLGDTILSLLGLDTQSFALAGSVVIFLLGLEMILGIHIFKSSPEGSAAGSLVPIAFPLLVGAGTLTVLISMRSVYSIYDILIAVLINSIIMYFVLRSTTWIELKIGKTALHAITKFFGVIALALAIKIFMTNFYHA